jgi:ABC-type branched-subunit amino acid transport system substrate-binding protein
VTGKSRKFKLQRRLRVLSVTCAALAALGAASCGTSGASSGNSPLVVGDIWPYSGPLAEFGPHSQAGCLAAAHVIDAAGGVLGHPIQCDEVDDKGDAVDAVPVVQKFLSTTSNLVGVSGPETDTSLALAPLLNNAKVPWVSFTGSAYFGKNKSPYFYRMALADAEYGATLAYAGHSSGYQRAAIVLGTNTGSQDLHTGMVEALHKLNSPKLVLDLSVAVDQSSYSAEVARIAAAHPDVILTELDPQTLTTLTSNLKSQYHMVNFITTASDLTSEVFTALDKTVGAASVIKYLHAASSQVSTSGPGVTTFRSAMQAISKSFPSAKQDMNDLHSQYTYDTVLIFAMAMEAAKSTNPEVFNGYITKITNGSADARTVQTYAAGKQALAAGKPIRYSGLIGPIKFDTSHTSTPPLGEFSFTSSGGYVPMAKLPSSVIQALVG